MKKQVTKTTKTVATEAALTPVAAPKAKIAAAKIAPTPVVAPVAIAELRKRVTPGAKVAEWRIVPSQRKGKPGFYLQGGSYQMQANGRNAFTVGAELYFEDRQDAQLALAQKRQSPAAA